MNRTFYDKLIFELSHEGRRGAAIPGGVDYDGSTASLPGALLREKPLDLPQVDEPTVVRHYTNLSTNNFGVDTGFYPLGSCTMKYNPKINEEMAALPGMSALHPVSYKHLRAHET